MKNLIGEGKPLNHKMSSLLFRIISNIRTTCHTGGREQSWNSLGTFFHFQSLTYASIPFFFLFLFFAATRNKFGFKRHWRSVGSAWNTLVSARVLSADGFTLQAQSDTLAEENTYSQLLCAFQALYNTVFKINSDYLLCEKEFFMFHFHFRSQFL